MRTGGRGRTADPKAKTSPGTRKRSRLLGTTEIVDINDVEFLKRFMTEYGKIIPARLTGVTAQQQRRIRQGIRRARNVGLLA